MAGRARRLGRWLGRGLIALGLLLFVLAASVYLVALASLPRVEGTIRVAGLAAPVTIVRDRHAIPHIEAESFLDATFAQGFLHAQDRLWQMEFQRRLGAGRLSEVVGPATLSFDRFMRMLGLYRLAEASLAHLEPETMAWLEAYAAGVNAQLATRIGPLPPEFLLLRHFQVEPWTPADSVVWVKLMALDLSANWRHELLRAQLAQRLPPEQVAEFWPDYPEEAPVSLAALARGLPADALAAVLPPAPPAPPASNAWVVDGSRTATGAPILANDPHLGMQAPGTWYLTHLRAPEAELVGTTLPGVPGIILGHNGHLAWGFTTTGGDVQDLFIERLDPQDPGRYLTPEGSAPFAVRDEVIAVRGSEPVTLSVRQTRHGPVISDLLPGEAGVLRDPDQVLALAWTALVEDDLSIQALRRMLFATDAASFVDALREVTAPQQNVLFATTAGQIGMAVPGRVPIRRRGDGRWPVPGWSGEHDWIGWIPFEELPHVVDPPDGVLLNANNKVVPDDYPHLIALDWEAVDRAVRIDELIAGEGHDLERSAAMQADILSPMARDLLPYLLALEPADARQTAALERLRAWDLVMRSEAPEPLIFSAWFRELSRLIYADELGDLFAGLRRARPEFVRFVLREGEVWCNDVTTPETESCEQQIERAFALALADLEQRFGADMAAWRWGEAHPAYMAHAVFQDVPALSWLFNISIPTGGDPTTLDVGHYRVHARERPFANVHAASYRGLFDLADLDRSRWINATGQSGHPLSPHYRDLARLWQRGDLVAMDRDPAGYRDGATGILQLTP
jgi:penicillin G amidase